MMDIMMGRMSKEEKEAMMSNMMDKFFVPFYTTFITISDKQ